MLLCRYKPGCPNAGKKSVELRHHVAGAGRVGNRCSAMSFMNAIELPLYALVIFSHVGVAALVQK